MHTIVTIIAFGYTPNNHIREPQTAAVCSVIFYNHWIYNHWILLMDLDSCFLPRAWFLRPQLISSTWKAPVGICRHETCDSKKRIVKWYGRRTSNQWFLKKLSIRRMVKISSPGSHKFWSRCHPKLEHQRGVPSVRQAERVSTWRPGCL